MYASEVCVSDRDKVYIVWCGGEAPGNRLLAQSCCLLRGNRDA